MVRYNKDSLNVVFCTFLYFIQSVPLGLIGSLPYLFTARQVSYAEQAFFSFASWPFSVKLLWAPVVDSVYNKFIGKRKTWLIPVQYIIGLMLILFADYVKESLDSKHANIEILTLIFFSLSFMAATQDIVVDGWVLTMFSNTSLGSTCESMGGTAGWFVGNVLFLVIESADFSNKYIRPIFGLESQSYGIFSIREFMILFGIIYLATTTLIVLFKQETTETTKEEENTELSLFETYHLVWKILCLKPIQLVIFIVFTFRLTLSAESMIYLKLVESGVPKEKLGILTIPLTPLQFFLPFLIGKILKNQSPFKYFSLAAISRSTIVVIVAGWIYMTPWFKSDTNELSFTYYLVTVCLEGIHSITVYSSYMPLMYFFSSISDKNYGATYMTFFNTVANLSRSFTQTGTLYLANFLTVKHCSFEANPNAYNATLVSMNRCISDLEKNSCLEQGGKCAIYFDSFFAQAVVCLFLGICWNIWIRKYLDNLEKLPKSSWIIYDNKLKLKAK